MSRLRFWIKSIVYSSITIGTGMLLLKTTPPAQPPPIGNAENDHKVSMINDLIKRNTESARPAWDIKWLEFCSF